MQFWNAKAQTVEEVVRRAVRGELDAAALSAMCVDSPELVSLALLAAAQRIAEQDVRLAELERSGIDGSPSLLASPDGSLSASTPSGMVPIYTKPNTQKRGRRKKPGARVGHKGVHRARPVRIDQREAHRLKRCPDCEGKLQRCARSRTRVIEDIPAEIEPVFTEHTIHRDYCPTCKKHVEPVVPDAMPGATLGHHVVALSSWFHYGLGLTIDQVVHILGYHLQTKLTPGGLVDAWHRLADVLRVWYEQIGEEAKSSATLHADETGWRVDGQTTWLWCFTNTKTCYYMIDRSRGSPALQKFFTEAFEGVLITDFWAAYGSVCADDRQVCLVHLLRELEAVDERNECSEWKAFAKKLRRLLGDGMRLRRRPGFSADRTRSCVRKLDQRLTELANEEPIDGDARRLTARLRKHVNHIFTFLEYDDVPFDNNFAERQIRPAVILRKNSQSNRSDRGAATQAVLMSVYRTLRLRGLDPTKTITNALKNYTTARTLPTLPERNAANG